MLRADLIALTADDLAALANRGLVKRAQKEVDSGALTAEWSQTDDGTVDAVWSDGVSCVLPGGKTVREAHCSCPALDLCRHLIRTVLAWQQHQQQGVDETAETEPWDPGGISDEAIAMHVPKPVQKQASRLWSQGVLAELLRTSKPSARFHLPGHTVRFLVPDDIRYVQCSCPDPAPCVHAVLAAKAFRLLPKGDESGIVNEGGSDAKVDPAPLLAANNCVAEALENGFANLGSAWRDRLHRIAGECTLATFPWPAMILEELAVEFDRYNERDSTFQPSTTLRLFGELLLRSDAIRSDCAPIPQAFIRGLKSDRDSTLGAARFVGLGASVEEGRKCTTIHSFLQDVGSGHVVTLSRKFSEDPETVVERKAFHQLALLPAVRDASISLLSAGQLVTQGGKRTASGRLIIGRARAAVNPQNFEWQHLKAPVLVEDYGELSARLALLPPSSFRPRHAGADFHVCPIAEILSPHFNAAENCVVAVLRDHSGHEMLLKHPWCERGAPGAEALLASLMEQRKPLFVSGHVRVTAGGLCIRPALLVVEEKTTGARSGVLPWLASHHDRASANLQPGNSLQRWKYDIAESLLEELMLSGRRRLASREWPGWHRRVEELEGSGYHKMAGMLSAIQQGESGGLAALTALKLLSLAHDCG